MISPTPDTRAAWQRGRLFVLSALALTLPASQFIAHRAQSWATLVTVQATYVPAH